MNLDQSFLRTLEKRDYSTDYARHGDQDQAIIKVQENCKSWLKNEQGNLNDTRSPQINSLQKKTAKSQENMKFIYKQMERTVCNEKTNKSFIKKTNENSQIQAPDFMRNQTEPNNGLMEMKIIADKINIKQQIASQRHSMEFEQSRSPQKGNSSSHQLKQMILKLNQKPSYQNSKIGKETNPDILSSIGGISKLNITNLQQDNYQSQSQSHQRSLTYREYDGFQVNLFDSFGRHVDQFFYKTQDRTTSDLSEILFERFQQVLQSSKKLIGFCTKDVKLPLDFYLTLKERDLNLINGTVVNLKPVYAEPVEETLSLNSFNFLLCVGVGGFSRVFLVRCKQTGQFIALKLISKAFITENEKHQIIQNERDIMVQLSQQKEPHPFLCKLVCSFETKTWVVFGVEYCPGGELFQQLKRVRKMNEQEARFYFLEVCLAILHLHQNNVIYRDIKPENILIDCDGHVKVADFGLSRPDMNEEALAYSFCGSPEYMAPEMLLKEGHNSQIDHYCLGALLYELLTGLPPYYSRDTEKIYKNILTKELSFPAQVCSPEARDLISQLLVKDKDKRLGRTHGIFEILNHPWLRKIQLQSVMSKQLSPPFVPNLLTFSFDQKEISKGEAIFQKDLQSSLNSNEENKFQILFQNFYFVGPSLKPNNPVKKNRKTESMFEQIQQSQSRQPMKQQQSQIDSDTFNDSKKIIENFQSQDLRSRSNDIRTQQMLQTKSHLINELQQSTQQSQQSTQQIFNQSIEPLQSSQKHLQSNERLDYIFTKASESQERTQRDKLSQSILSRVCSAKQIFPTKSQQKYQSIDRLECEHFASQSTLKNVKPSVNINNISQTRTKSEKPEQRQMKKTTPQKTPLRNSNTNVQGISNGITSYLKENQQLIKSNAKQALNRSTSNRTNKTTIQLKKRPEKSVLVQQLPNYNGVRQHVTEPDSSFMFNNIYKEIQPQNPNVATKPIFQSQTNLTKHAYNKTLQNIFSDYNTNQRPVNQQERSKLYQTNDQSISTLKFFNARNI